MNSLLNWDDGVNPTTHEDFIENIRDVVSRYTGYVRTCITLADGVLRVEALENVSHPSGTLLTDGVEVYEEIELVSKPTTLLALDVSYPMFPRELYGRVSHIGLGSSYRLAKTIARLTA